MRLRKVDDEHGERVPATQLRRGDLVLVVAGEVIPGDGDVSKASPRSTNRRSPANPPR